MEIVKDNEVLLEAQKFFTESAKENIKNYPEKRELPNKRPEARDYNDLIDFMDAMSKYEIRNRKGKRK